MDKYYHHCDQDTQAQLKVLPQKIGKGDLCEEQVQQLLRRGDFERTSERVQPFSFG